MPFSDYLGRRGPAVLHEALGKDQELRGVLVESRPNSRQMLYRRGQTSQVCQIALHVLRQGRALSFQSVSRCVG